MSITDMTAGRITQAPVRSFGNRRVPPPLPRPPSAPGRSIAWRPHWPSLSGLPERLLELWRRLSPSLQEFVAQARLHARQAAKALPRGSTAVANWSWKAVFRALLRSVASTALLRIAAYMAALGLLGLIAVHVARLTSTAFESGPAAPAAEWVTVAKPFPAFSLSLPELADSNPGYAMRRNVAGGGRQDILSWGEMNGLSPHVMIEVYRPAGEAAGFDSAALEIAARLKNGGAATMKPAGMIDTKFGEMALVAFTMGPARQCLGFVRAYIDPQLQILGWHCVSGSAPPSRDLAACALDRLTLLAAGSEPKVRELFARAELKRTFCGQRSHLMTPLPKLGGHGPAKWEPVRR